MKNRQFAHPMLSGPTGADNYLMYENVLYEKGTPSPVLAILRAMINTPDEPTVHQSNWDKPRCGFLEVVKIDNYYYLAIEGHNGVELLNTSKITRIDSGLDTLYHDKYGKEAADFMEGFLHLCSSAPVSGCGNYETPVVRLDITVFSNDGKGGELGTDTISLYSNDNPIKLALAMSELFLAK